MGVPFGQPAQCGSGLPAVVTAFSLALWVESILPVQDDETRFLFVPQASMRRRAGVEAQAGRNTVEPAAQICAAGRGLIPQLPESFKRQILSFSFVAHQAIEHTVDPRVMLQKQSLELRFPRGRRADRACVFARHDHCLPLRCLRPPEAT